MNVVGKDQNSNGIYAKCFWDKTVNPTLTGIGNSTDPNVIGETTTNLQKIITYTNARWDFLGEDVNGTDDIWQLCIDDLDYPRLVWQFGTADFVRPGRVCVCR